jgi:hypothetical protein
MCSLYDAQHWRMRAEEMREIANSMGEHIFQVGQMVAYRKASGPYAPPGTYIVTAHLPEINGEPSIESNIRARDTSGTHRRAISAYRRARHRTAPPRIRPPDARRCAMPKSVEPEKWYLVVDCSRCLTPIPFAAAPSPEDEPNYTAPEISKLTCPECGHKDTYAPALMSRQRGPEK